MWDEVVTKLARLKALDVQLQVFGAEHHCYQLYPNLPEETLARFEGWLGVALPDELRVFYRDVGNEWPVLITACARPSCSSCMEVIDNLDTSERVC